MPHPNTTARARAGSLGHLQSLNSQIQRFDGRTRSASRWNSLRRDPELWYDDGDCLVYLYARGQSQRGPSFRVPFSGLVEADCYPLIYRFIAPESGLQWHGHDSDSWHAASPVLELHIPPPAGLTGEQSLSYHLATRNLFAWVYRRPLVGQYLGEALAQLLDSMHKSRLPGIDNERELIDYMEDEGYLAMKNNPCAAVATLFVSEMAQLREMYMDAFAHCTGMYAHLDSTPGYHLLSLTSKSLLSGSKADLDIRLTEATTQLRDFATTDLAGSYGSTASFHVDAFRDFLVEFYKDKFGKWPPHPGRAPLDKHVFFALSYDFECLRELLVNESVGCEDKPARPSGLDVQRVLAGYDKRRGFESQKHPTSLIPAVIPRQATWRRLSGLGSRVKPDNRLLANASLARSYNGSSSRVLRNDLVQSYRRFEEDVVTASKEMSICEGRKARWIVVYAVCQILRRVTEAPSEVIDADGVDYHVAISTEGLLPWGEDGADVGPMGVRPAGKPLEATSSALPAIGRTHWTRTRLRPSASHTTMRSVSTSLPSHTAHRRLSTSFRSMSLSISSPARRFRHLALTSAPPQSSGSSWGYESVVSPLDTSPTEYTPSLPDSILTASSIDASTPPSSPPSRPPPLDASARKGRSRHVVSMMPAAAHGPLQLRLSTLMARKPGGRPMSTEFLGSESEWPVETSEYAVGYATTTEAEREAMYGARDGVFWI